MISFFFSRWQLVYRTCLLVDLDGGLIGIDPNDLSDQLVLAYSYQLVHGHTNHVLGDHDGPALY